MTALAIALLALFAPSPSRVQVSADEFTLALSRTTVRSGPVIVELVNYGEDDHDVAIRRARKGSRTFRTTVIRPGRLGRIETRLAPGRYRLWCTLADHRQRGMTGALVVKAA